MSDAPPDERLVALHHVCSAFEQMDLKYVLGGSMASSLYGDPRSTNDADVMVDSFAGRESEFQSFFSDDYYLSPTAIEEANRDSRSFNIIYVPMAFKVDVFVTKNRPFDREVIRRRVQAQLIGGTDEKLLPVQTAEDVILSKLEWYRAGDEISENQWKDITHMLRRQHGYLDTDYLRHWAEELGVDDLLERAEQHARA